MVELAVVCLIIFALKLCILTNYIDYRSFYAIEQSFSLHTEAFVLDLYCSLAFTGIMPQHTFMYKSKCRVIVLPNKNKLQA